MSSVLQSLAFWLAGFIILIVAALRLKENKQKVARQLLLIFASCFVVVTLAHSIFSDNRLSKTPSLNESDRAELQLRIHSAIESLTMRIPAAMVLKDKPDKLLDDSESSLIKAADQENDPDSWLKLIILQGYRHEDTNESIGRLSQLTNADSHEMASALTALYGRAALSKKEAAHIQNILERNVKPGWFKDQILFRLYRQSGQPRLLSMLSAQFEQKSYSLIGKLIWLVAFIIIAVLVGLLIIFIQLFFLPRRITDAAQQQLVQAPADYGATNIYAVFIAWLGTQLLVGLIVQQLLKDVSPVATLVKNAAMSEGGVLVAALAMALLYCLSNGPGVLYAYYFALRPHAITFVEGLKLRTKVGKAGLGSLILFGILTWFAAVPLVIGGYWIAMQLGSHGSSNPVIALVMAAAKSANPAATIIFYLTLGVFAPFCEETLFRGFLYSSLRRRLSILPAMILSAVLFAALHLDLGGFVPLFCLGCVFAFVFERTKSVIPSMIAHGLWNSGTFSLMLLLFSN